MSTLAKRAIAQGETVCFGGLLLTVALVLNLTAPPDPGDQPGLYLALRDPSWPKGQCWIVPMGFVEQLTAVAA